MPPSKGTTQRRVSSPLSKVSTPASTEKGSKSSKPSRVIKLKVPNARLSRFPHESTPSKSVPKKKSPLSTNTLATPSDPPHLEETKSESNDTLALASSKTVPPPAEETVKNEPSSPKTGTKRELGAGVEEPVKVRARPGPKKKPRL